MAFLSNDRPASCGDGAIESAEGLKKRLREDVVALMPALHAFSRRFYRDQTNADDLVQETLLKALANLERFEERQYLSSSIKSWMFTIMRNTFYTRLKIAKRESPGLVECVASRETMEPTQEWTVAISELQTALLQLPEQNRSLIVNVALGGESYEEAALRMNCAVGTIKSRINRARCQLGEALDNSSGAAMVK